MTMTVSFQKFEAMRLRAERIERDSSRVVAEFQSERDAAKRDAMRAFDERNLALDRAQTAEKQLQRVQAASERLRQRVNDIFARRTWYLDRGTLLGDVLSGVKELEQACKEEE